MRGAAHSVLTEAMKQRKKLIEVALPLDAINKASAREKSIRHGHPSTLHLWWARRPLAAARAVIFAQMVDDPSICPDLFPTEKAQERERQRLFRIIEDLVLWENTTNEAVLQKARDEIWQSWRRACAENVDHPRAKELFDRHKLPAFHDPFAGGGSLPLEAQRLGLEAYASDLNPVAVLINKAMIEIPPRFAGLPPVNPGYRAEVLGDRDGEDRVVSRSQGLAEGDGSRRGGVSAGEASTQGGGVSVDQSVAAGRGLGASEYRGGPREGDATGLRELHQYRERISRRDRDVPPAGRESQPSVGAASGASTEAHRRAGQDAQRPPSTPDHLNPKTYPLFSRTWRGAQGLAEDVRYYGQWMRDEAEKRIGHLYPKIEVTAEMAKERPDLKPLVGRKLTVVAWLWARTVKSPNPAFAQVDVPLVSSFMLSTKAGKGAYVEPMIEGDGYRFTVKLGKPKDVQVATNGTKLARGSFRCLFSNVPIGYAYIDGEANAGRMGARLMGIVAEGDRGRVYLPPTLEMEAVAQKAQPTWKPDAPSRGTWASNAQGRRYGFRTFGDYFTPRQLVALTTFSDLVQEARERVERDARAAGLSEDGCGLDAGGTGAVAYADAVAVYLGLTISKMSDAQSSLVRWKAERDRVITTFSRQALQMVWDYAESNTFAGGSGDYGVTCHNMVRVLDSVPAGPVIGAAFQAAVQDAQASIHLRVYSFDPPYYDNIGYADLSDFFYVWLRRSLKSIFSNLFATLAVPKAEELVACSYRHGGKDQAEAFFLDGMTRAMHRLAEQAHPAFPVTIYYAFRQSESADDSGTTSTGWETFLDAVIRAGFALTGTWPMRTERAVRSVGIGTNVLASSIVLVCRPKAASASTATRREFLTALKVELPVALTHLQRGNIAPVDLAQAAIGPGMAVYTRYAKVLDAEGKPLSVREALALINQTLDEALAEQEGDFDADSRWALAWFEQSGFADGEFGVADVLARAKNTSVAGMVEADILASSRGKVRLLRPDELAADWDPTTDPRLTAWEMVHHLIRSLEAGGEGAAAELVAKLGSKAEVARELAYRLYTLCERKKRAPEALAYNGLVQSWPEITRLARDGGKPRGPEQQELL